MRETLSKERERREQRGEGDDDDETPEGGESVLRVPEDMRVRRQKHTDALWKMYQRRIQAEEGLGETPEGMKKRMSN